MTTAKGGAGWVLGDHSAETFAPLWSIVAAWNCYSYVMDGWSVYPGFIAEGDQIVCKTYMTWVEGKTHVCPWRIEALCDTTWLDCTARHFVVLSP